MLVINEKINGVNVDISFHNGVNCIDLGMSGTGKTFMMTIIKSYCVKHSIDYKFFDYSSKCEDVQAILNNGGAESPIVVMDNADLYMNDELSEIMDKKKDTVFIISMKKRRRIKATYTLCRLKYQNNEISCKGGEK